MSQLKYQALEVLILYQSVGQFRPVFQIDIDIYENYLGQSGDRILYGHITRLSTFIVCVSDEGFGEPAVC